MQGQRLIHWPSNGTQGARSPTHHFWRESFFENSMYFLHSFSEDGPQAFVVHVRATHHYDMVHRCGREIVRKGWRKNLQALEQFIIAVMLRIRVVGVAGLPMPRPAARPTCGGVVRLRCSTIDQCDDNTTQQIEQLRTLVHTAAVCCACFETNFNSLLNSKSI